MNPLTGKLLVGLAIAPLIFTAAFASVEDADKRVAVAVAEAVDAMVRSTRSIYTKTVVLKLKKDGKGAKQRSEKLKGFVPLPAQFVRNVALHLDNSQTAARFKIELRSIWNLNPEQGLQDDFEKAGWEYLMKQQEAAGGDFAGIEWEPYVEVENQGGKNTLRYFSADTAAVQACARCHNNWEKRASIKNMRKVAGLTLGKTFELNELMGAVSISVALD